ncbi:MAG: tetratricopeptide repeat protein [Candidatus Micrarchaeaceae archaeon]
MSNHSAIEQYIIDNYDQANYATVFCECNQLLLKEPDNIIAKRYYVLSLYKLFSYDYMIKLLDDVIKVSASIEDYMQLGKIYLDFNQIANAIDAFNNALDMSNTYEINQYLALCYNQKGDLDKASEHLQKAIEIDPDKVDAYIDLFNILYNNQNSEKIGELIELFSKKTQNAQVRFTFANYSFSIGNYQQTIDFCSELLQSDPNNAEYLKLRAYAYFQLLDNPSAQADISTALKLKPDDIESHILNVMINFEQKDIDDVKQSALQIINDNTIDLFQRIRAHEYLGDSYALKDYTTAIDYYTKAIDLYSSGNLVVDIRLLLKRADLFLKLNDIEKAERDISLVLNESPNNIDALRQMLLIRIHQNNFDEVTKITEKIKEASNPSQLELPED